VEGSAAETIARFGAARADPALAVLEGFHAIKHALRFGGDVELVATSAPDELAALADELAPDVAARLSAAAVALDPAAYARLGPRAHHTRVAAVARRPPFDPAAVLAARRDAPAVLLDDPRHLGNLGAVVRVAAGADAACVATVGESDPWDPVAIRGSAGLHFALPVGRLAERPVGPEGVPTGGRPLIALDPDGDELDPAALPSDALLAFGSERHGLGEGVLATADARLRIPMRPGVSSLNLATSVAAVLFAWRLAAGPGAAQS